jgi:hypothetical protein
MDDFRDNVTQMPPRVDARTDGLPKFNMKNLSLFNEDGHLTVTFWLLCAAVVVAIYLVIEAMSAEEEPIVPVPMPEPVNQNNHRPTSNPRPRVAKTEEAKAGDA